MKRYLFVSTLTLILIYTTLGFISYQTTFPLVIPSPSLDNGKFYDYAGITHAQTSRSIGSGSVAELARAASVTGCQFVIVTDLNFFDSQGDIEGYKNDVLMIAGGKFSFLGGHLLTYGFSSQWPFNGAGQAQIYFNELLQNPPRIGNMLVAANPYLPRHTWENLSLPGLTGMEILNLDSLWQSKLTLKKFSVAWSLLMLPFNPDLSYLRLFSEPNHEIRAWDENLQHRQFYGWAGSGATAKMIPFPDSEIKFPSYRRSFKLIKNHVLLKSELTGVFQNDKEKILVGLSLGHFYFSVDILGDPAGFYFTATKHGKEFMLGDQIESKDDVVKLVADLGHEVEIPHEIILIKDGKVISATHGQVLKTDVAEKGSYRVVVKISPTLPLPDGRTTFSWIYSNPIRIY